MQQFKIVVEKKFVVMTHLFIFILFFKLCFSIPILQNFKTEAEKIDFTHPLKLLKINQPLLNISTIFEDTYYYRSILKNLTNEEIKIGELKTQVKLSYPFKNFHFGLRLLSANLLDSHYQNKNIKVTLIDENPSLFFLTALKVKEQLNLGLGMNFLPVKNNLSSYSLEFLYLFQFYPLKLNLFHQKLHYLYSFLVNTEKDSLNYSINTVSYNYGFDISLPVEMFEFNLKGEKINWLPYDYSFEEEQNKDISLTKSYLNIFSFSPKCHYSPFFSSQFDYTHWQIEQYTYLEKNSEEYGDLKTYFKADLYSPGLTYKKLNVQIEHLAIKPYVLREGIARLQIDFLPLVPILKKIFAVRITTKKVYYFYLNHLEANSIYFNFSSSINNWLKFNLGFKYTLATLSAFLTSCDWGGMWGIVKVKEEEIKIPLEKVNILNILPQIFIKWKKTNYIYSFSLFFPTYIKLKEKPLPSSPLPSEKKVKYRGGMLHQISFMYYF